MNSALFSSAKSEWATPQWLFDALHARFGFTLDVCATHDNAKLPRYFSPADDGLSQSWHGERCYCNPPYGRQIALWVAKARQEATGGCLVVGLLPARTDAKWWQENVRSHAEVHFIAGRLKFGNADNSAPFPSAIAVWTGLEFLYAPKNRSQQKNQELE
ncbi:MAG: phage N-6-adenine-methyltransferase [Fibromonadales bacterium]|nr:phage N-6-adenine-methyltransferase [Fibromonadales bacterium]